MPAPASEPAKASNAGNAVAMDDVVDTLAEAAAKAMPGDMPASEKEEMTQAMAQAVKYALPKAMAEAETPPTTEPVRLKSGQFRGQDRFSIRKRYGNHLSPTRRLPACKTRRPPSNQLSGLAGHPHAESKPGGSGEGNRSEPLGIGQA